MKDAPHRCSRLVRALGLTGAAIALSSCALREPLTQLWPKKKPQSTAIIQTGSAIAEPAIATSTLPNAPIDNPKLGHIINSTQPPPLRLALRAAQPPPDRYRPVAPHNPDYIRNATLDLAPAARDVPTDMREASGLRLALRAADAPRPRYVPIPEIIQTSPVTRYPSTLKAALVLAPVTLTDTGPGPDIAPLRANALVSIDPSVTESGHFYRPLRPYKAIDEPVLAATSRSVDSFRMALASAYRNNPSLAAERVRVKETDEGYIQARAQSRPQLAAQGQITTSVLRAPAGGTLSTNIETPAEAALTITQPLYQGGRLRALKRQAKTTIMAARQRLVNESQSILLETATAYADVVRDDRVAAIRRDTLRVVARQKRVAEDRYDVGEGTTTDIFQAEARLADAEIAVAQSAAQLAISRARLARLMGRTPTEFDAVPIMHVPDSLDDTLSFGHVNNPQLRALWRDFDASFETIKIAQSASRPTLNLQGRAGGSRAQQSGLTRRDDASVALQLRVPIYAGGLNTSRKRSARLTRDRLYYEVLETERAITEVLERLWAERLSAITGLDEARAQELASLDAFEGVKAERDFGQRDLLDVLNAENEYQNARARVVVAERNRDVATFRLLNVMGVFGPNHLSLPVVVYDPSKNLNEIAKSKYSVLPPRVIIEE